MTINEITKFTPEVVKVLDHYVYRLIDPRDGQTFYVGRGQGNRVFAHVHGALKNYENQNYFSPESEDDLVTKIQQIKEIANSGLEVIHLIQRYGLTKDEAMEVEAALIDCFPGLTNKQSGYDPERGVTNAITLQNTFEAEIYEEPKDIDYMIIKIRQATVDFEQGDIYEATRSCWKINPKNAEGKYVLSVINGIVKKVYEVAKWTEVSNTNGRYEFIGKEAEEKIRNIFVGKRIPENYRKKGAVAPVLYKK